MRLAITAGEGGKVMSQMETMIDRLNRHDVEAEMALLGSLLHDSSRMSEVIQVLSGPGDFHQQGHVAIYSVIQTLWEQGGAVDIVQIKAALQARKWLKTAGGVEYLIELGESTPSSAGAAAYARIVRDAALQRDAVQVLVKAMESLGHAGGDGDTATKIAEITDRLDALSPSAESQRVITAGAAMMSAYNDLEDRTGRAVIQTGLANLDHLLGGLHAGELVLLAARPSVGKTAMGLTIACSLCLDSEVPVPVALFSLEMSSVEIGSRLLAMQSGVDGMAMRRLDLSSDNYQAMAQAAGGAADRPLHIDASPAMTISQLRGRAKRLQHQHKIKLVMVDYLTLIEATGDSLREQVTNIGKGLKRLARELSVPVIAMAQLNRQPESRSDHRPRLSDLRESGTLEQEADVVVLIHRDDVTERHKSDYHPTGEAELIVAKNRNGSCGVCRAQFVESRARFYGA